MPSAPIYRTLVRPRKGKGLRPVASCASGYILQHSRRWSLERTVCAVCRRHSALAPCTITFHDFGSTGPKFIVISAGEQLNRMDLSHGIVGLRTEHHCF